MGAGGGAQAQSRCYPSGGCRGNGIVRCNIIYAFVTDGCRRNRLPDFFEWPVSVGTSLVWSSEFRNVSSQCRSFLTSCNAVSQMSLLPVKTITQLKLSSRVASVLDGHWTNKGRAYYSRAWP